ncbi:MAG: phosphoribosylformylglycinamidine synthase subunit PurQ, partial [Oscillospiraceae bacterium]
GRFVADDAAIANMLENGQIATQYVDINHEPTMDIRCNPNGSLLAIEGITSADGRILGKMGHTERSGDNLYKNIDGDKYQKLFEGGMAYYKL